MNQVPTMSQAQISQQTEGPTSRQTEDHSLEKKRDSPLEQREAEERGSASVVTGSPKVSTTRSGRVVRKPARYTDPGD